MNVVFEFFIRPNISKSIYREYEKPFNGNGSIRSVTHRSRVVFLREGKNVQYPEEIVSEGREASLKYPYWAHHCQVYKT